MSSRQPKQGISDQAHGPPPGLCGRCRHVRIVEAQTGSRFYLCRLAAVDPAFTKYPPIPVLECEGYEAAPDAG